MPGPVSDSPLGHKVWLWLTTDKDGSNQRRPRNSEGVAPVNRRNTRLKALTSE